jgi:DNA-binding NarL/FixJ family response regulator
MRATPPEGAPGDSLTTAAEEWMKEAFLRFDNDGDQDGIRPLTIREREILRMLAAGLSTTAIAKDLSISSTTVRNHVQRIISKLQVHSRLAAVAQGYAKGFISWEAFHGQR